MIQYNPSPIRLNALLKGEQPISKEELEWFENWKEVDKKSSEIYQKQAEDFQKRLEDAKEEANELRKKYLPKEYLKDGLYKSKEFESFENKMYEQTFKEVQEILSKKIEPEYSKIALKSGYVSERILDFYIRDKVVEKIRKKYKDYLPEVDIAPEEFYEELKKIKEKYKVPTAKI